MLFSEASSCVPWGVAAFSFSLAPIEVFERLLKRSRERKKEREGEKEREGGREGGKEGEKERV